MTGPRSSAPVSFNAGGDVNPDVQALLVVQGEDEAIRELEARGAALAPRMAALDASQRRAQDRVARAEADLERERVKQRLTEGRLADHRARHEKSVALLNNAHKVKEATAAGTQVEAARRALAEEESELLAVMRRVADLRTALAAHREVLEQVTADQAAARSTIGAEAAALAAELAAARARRALSARGVEAGLLAKYDRVQSKRRTTVLVELRDFCCSACDTAIPLQRRPAMSTGMRVEPCEACGVLLYCQPAPADAPPA